MRNESGILDIKVEQIIEHLFDIKPRNITDAELEKNFLKTHTHKKKHKRNKRIARFDNIPSEIRKTRDFQRCYIKTA